MFRLSGFKLHNICQHADLSVSLDAGLVAVIGANGVGKTNCVRGLVYALTGQVDGLWGNQQTLQRDYAADIGYAEAMFTDGDVSYRIRRYATSSVKFPDIVVKEDTMEVVAQRRQKVNEFMESVFGIPCQLMFQVCWGRQGELAMLLKSTPAMVGAFLQQVFDMKPLERLREKLKLQMDTIAVLPQNARAMVDADRSELASLPTEESLQASVDQLASAVDALEKLRAEMERARATGMDPSARDRELDMARQSLEAVEAQLAASADVAVPDTSRSPVAIHEDLVRETIRSQELSHSWNRLKWERESAEAAIEDADRRLKAFNDECLAVGSRTAAPSGDVCMFCGGRITDRRRYDDAVLKFSTGQESREAYDEHVASRRKELDAERDAALARASEARDREQVAADAVKRCEDHMRELEAESAVAVLVAARDTRDGLRRHIKELEDTPTLSRDLSERYAETCSLLDQSRAGLRAAMEALAENKARRAMLERAIEDNARAAEQYDINSEAREVLSSIRDALSQSRAQARYLKARIRGINVELERYLAYTGMPFSLRLDEDTRTFVFTTQDGAEHPAAHLSGAQQAMSAVALQMALFSVMRPSMNLYVIDEPTEALDVVNKAVMASMFERMNAMLPSVEGTMLIITRDAPVVQSCGQVLEIKEDDQ